MAKYTNYRTAEWLLNQWGMWARENPCPHTGFPSMTAVQRLVAKGGETCQINDDEGIFIDKILAELGRESRPQLDAIYLKYHSRWSLRKISEGTSTPKTTVVSLLDGGLCWFKGRIAGVRTLDANVL